MSAAPDPLLRFYQLEGADARGRTLAEIWTWDAGRLESVHDYIQWLFPLPEPSAFNPQAPILTAAAIRAFHGDERLRAHLRRSLTSLLAFYGLELSGGREAAAHVWRSAAFAERSRVWLHAGNHNHLRLSRILASLRLLGLHAESAALYACLVDVARDHPHAVSATTLQYWARASAG